MAIGSAIVAGVSMVASYAGQQQQAQASELQQQVNNDLAIQDALDQYSQLSAAERDVNSQAMESLNQNQLSMLELQERAKLLAGASGTQGASVNSMLSDIASTGGKNQATIIANRANQLSEITKQAQGIYSGARRGLDTRSLSKPSAVQALQTGMQTYQGAQQMYKAYQEM